MPFFEGATNVNASHSVFNDIQGDQVNYYGSSRTGSVDISAAQHAVAAAGFHASFFNRSNTMGTNTSNTSARASYSYNPNNNPVAGHHISFG
jgi:hypothetical protein